MYGECMFRKCTEGFRKLIAWKEAKALTIKVYKMTEVFPKSEVFGITSQMRRASASSMSNIAEGSAMPTKSHRDAYYARAKGSVTEIDSFTELCLELGFIARIEYNDIVDHCARLMHLIIRLIESH